MSFAEKLLKARYYVPKEEGDLLKVTYLYSGRAKPQTDSGCFHIHFMAPGVVEKWPESPTVFQCLQKTTWILSEPSPWH